MTALRAEIIAIVYANPENGYTVARSRIESEPGQSTLVGCMPGVSPGEMVEITGQWKEHPKFGRQFAVQTCQQLLPATEAGIRRYLGSGLIRGLGPVMAARLVDHFGAAVLDILDNDPEQVLQVEGIGQKKLESIRSSWNAQHQIRGLMLFLQTHEIPPGYAARIFRRWGPDSLAKVRENPYNLASDVPGIGFRMADAMALKLGFQEDCAERMEAAVLYALKHFNDKGHVFTPRAQLMKLAGEILVGAEPGPIEQAIAALAQRKRILIEPLPDPQSDPQSDHDEEAVYLMAFYRMERDAAMRLQAIAAHPAGRPSAGVPGLLRQAEDRARLTLSEEQREAVLRACTEKVCIITGGPGTGKTTITRMICRVFEAQGLKIKLAAPTGRASKRLGEATGQAAATIHRLLGYSPDGGFTHNEEKKLKVEALIVDEVSMLDLPLLQHLLRALPLTCRLILVGDADQLPSVGPGNVLRDLLRSGTVPSCTLTQIFRQARQSLIVVNAHRINQGQYPLDGEREPGKSDFFWVEQEDPSRIVELIQQLVCQRIPEVYGLDALQDIQVLAPMHKGEVGTMNLNTLLQEKLNPRGVELRRGGQAFRVGDRVLQTRNNYERDVFNGDLGWIRRFDEAEGEVEVDFDGRTVRYPYEEMDELALAYAVSVHKSQGSEYPAVVMPVVTQHYMLLQRNLLYTALTRARKLAVLIGGKKALGMALRNAESGKRFTRLEERLKELG
jgi:exodeoxyribonuclease V alpha subunit